jgi:glycosyltransferase involved in cell wall biosynthesis
VKKAKILYIITKSNWGGAQKYVFDLATGFAAEFDVVVAAGGHGELANRLREKNIRFSEVKNLVREIRPCRDLLAFFEIISLIRRERPDVVHTNSSKAEILGNLSAWIMRVPRVIFTAHGFVFNENVSFCQKKFYVWWEQLASLFADKIICVSNYDRASAIENGVGTEKKLAVIHNGIATDKSEAARRGERGKIIIGTIANLEKNKALQYFIQAAKILNGKYADLEFRIIGEGLERPFLEQEIARLGLSNFKLLGFQAEAWRLLPELDIFALSSTKEGFPYVILEAMAAGLPVVATRVGGIAEAIMDDVDGFLVAPADAEALAEKIGILIEDQEKRVALGAQARAKVQTEFSSAGMLAATRGIMNETK